MAVTGYSVVLIRALQRLILVEDLENKSKPRDACHLRRFQISAPDCKRWASISRMWLLFPEKPYSKLDGLYIMECTLCVLEDRWFDFNVWQITSIFCDLKGTQDTDKPLKLL